MVGELQWCSFVKPHRRNAAVSSLVQFPSMGTLPGYITSNPRGDFYHQPNHRDPVHITKGVPE